MSYSWVDPHFAARYERREEERLAERLVSTAREHAAGEQAPDSAGPRDPAAPERHRLRGGHPTRL